MFLTILYICVINLSYQCLTQQYEIGNKKKPAKKQRSKKCVNTFSECAFKCVNTYVQICVHVSLKLCLLGRTDFS